MPRGVRGSVDYDAQIQKLDEKIIRYTNILSSLKKQRKDLISKKQEADLQNLYSYMQQNGMSAADVISHLVPDSVAATSTNQSDELI